MHCFNENNADLLIAYFENTLSDAQRAEVEAHAAQCAECRGLLAAHTALDAYSAPAVSLNFDARLYARIQADQARPWWHVSNWKLAIPVTAVAAMLAIGVFMYHPLQDVPPEGTKQAEIDAQQLEQALDDVELLMPLTQASNI
jgi:anti-sigma factor RsiW